MFDPIRARFASSCSKMESTKSPLYLHRRHCHVVYLVWRCCRKVLSVSHWYTRSGYNRFIYGNIPWRHPQIIFFVAVIYTGCRSSNTCPFSTAQTFPKPILISPWHESRVIPRPAFWRFNWADSTIDGEYPDGKPGPFPRYPQDQARSVAACGSAPMG